MKRKKTHRAVIFYSSLRLGVSFNNSSALREFVSAFALRLIRVLQAYEFLLDKTLDFDFGSVHGQFVERLDGEVQFSFVAFGFFARRDVIAADGDARLGKLGDAIQRFPGCYAPTRCLREIVDLQLQLVSSEEKGRAFRDFNESSIIRHTRPSRENTSQSI